MEDLIFSYSDKFHVKTARFANVAFSNGSLPAGFLLRLEKHQPLCAPSDVKRYFVSPEESGQICMLSCILGKNREIFFPKLNEAQMMRFDDIARLLLKAYDYIPLECSSDEEAILNARPEIFKSKRYPVHFSISNTSGEKETEEFFTKDESCDLERFSSLGVITGKPIPDVNKISSLLDRLTKVLDDNNLTKAKVVEILKDYLPNFEHREKNMSLDSKM